jgi:pyrimidine-nucleoside phosphorylase
MSKKLAEGLNGLVLDVKTGSGAFMKKYEDSEHLARLMVSTGEGNGTRTVALLTTMDEPLGRFSGNWIEVWECIDIMKGVHHPMYADLIELSITLAGWMLYLGGVCSSADEGKAKSLALLNDGSAYAKWIEMTKLQGGDIKPFDDPAAFHKPADSRVIAADRDGYLSCMDCTQVGWAVQRLGAGREKPGAPVAAHAGIEMHVKIGARIAKGQPLATLFTEKSELLDASEKLMRSTLRIEDTPPIKQPLIRQIIVAERER